MLLSDRQLSSLTPGLQMELTLALSGARAFVVR